MISLPLQKKLIYLPSDAYGIKFGFYITRRRRRRRRRSRRRKIKYEEEKEWEEEEELVSNFIHRTLKIKYSN
jgi:hypothetical protein